MATKSTKRSGSKKAQKPRMEARDLKPSKDPKGAYKEQGSKGQTLFMKHG